MKHIFLSTLVFLMAIVANAQDTEQPTLTIKGTSSASVKPTETTVSFRIEAQGTSYTGTINELIRRVDLLTSSLKKLKFEDHEIVTSSFSVDKNKKYDRGEWKELGYLGVQNVKVTFGMEKKTLLKVLNETTDSQANPEISISFGLDKERQAKLKNELLQQAVKDARLKADLLAGAADYEVAGIKSIQYHEQSGGGPRPMYAMAESAELSRKADVQFSNFEADNLNFQESANIVFYLQSAK
ncbi:SIMPL domain-containing protein [Marinoscillum furvescens]|uniref:Uncharacterized protein YggE n=1 Tax=Marinoscillum furvescens DSM 4134 TaxID=1122208 RepID=A0A3D9LI31_MARFU|nr:SIMPL domain-containing protein [Marinoscillum furvescens]REE05689.1 uncharacterized protein YggE [Marinoscillum furvescens DSM 4134]